MGDEPRIHGWVRGRYQPDPERPRYVVDCKLYDTCTTRDVCWVRGNSYVLAEVRDPRPDRAEDWYWKRDGKYFQIISINGAGEVRWSVSKNEVRRSPDSQVVAQHFHLEVP